MSIEWQLIVLSRGVKYRKLVLRILDKAKISTQIKKEAKIDKRARSNSPKHGKPYRETLKKDGLCL